MPDRTVRVRIKDEKGYITVKGKSSDSGMTRFEWEKEISTDEAKELLSICEEGMIDKSRYLVKVGNHTFEVDEFYGGNKGLIMAEVELESEDEPFERPSWLDREVTGDKRYYNAYLSNNPFAKWKN